MIKISKSGPPITQDRVFQFESLNEIKLPNDYKSFLIKHNGGKPAPNYFPLTGHREDASDVVLFYGIDYPSESLELQWNFDLNKGYFEDPAFDNFFQIANDGFNDKICLDLSEERFGAVVFIDMVPMWKEHTPKDIYVIADSFSSFLDMLFEVEDED